MARIILEPGEAFEHYHAGRSLTMLTSGNAELHMTGSVQSLELQRPVEVPPATAHRLVNVGPGEAVIYCGKCN